LKEGHGSARPYDRDPDFVDAAAHGRPTDFDDCRGRFSRLARVKEQKRVARPQPAHARDVPRRPRVEREISRLEVVHGNAEHGTTRSTGGV
jgi:hypothetical protein